MTAVELMNLPVFDDVRGLLDNQQAETKLRAVQLKIDLEPPSEDDVLAALQTYEITILKEGKKHRQR